MPLFGGRAGLLPDTGRDALSPFFRKEKNGEVAEKDKKTLDVLGFFV